MATFNEFNLTDLKAIMQILYAIILFNIQCFVKAYKLTIINDIKKLRICTTENLPMYFILKIYSVNLSFKLSLITKKIT